MSTTPSISPPRTPDDRRLSANIMSTTTPPSDDSSIIDDLSFDYIQDSDGNIVRLSKGSSSKSNFSSPPTPQDSSSQPDIPAICELPAPDFLQVSPTTRATLSRSDGTSSASSSAAQKDRPARSFQRVASGPLLNQTPSYQLSTSHPSLSKPRAVPRRVTMEDARDRLESVGASRSRQTLDSNAYSHTLQDEKENISESDEVPIIQSASLVKKHRNSPPLALRSTSAISTRSSSASNRTPYGSSNRPLTDLAQRAAHVRQILPVSNRAARIVKSSSLSKYSTSSVPPNFDRISEVESGDNDQVISYLPASASAAEDTEPEDEFASEVPSAQDSIPSNVLIRSKSAANSLSLSGSSRPRRSASLSDALKQDNYQLQLEHQYREPISRPGTSSGFSSDAATARRIASHGDKQELDLRKYRQHDDHQSRQSPSPTHSGLQSSRTPYNHKRRDSDTLRAAPSSAGLYSPTIVEYNKGSPPETRLQSRYSPPGVTRGRLSPPKGRDTPPTAAVKGRLSPGSKDRLSPASASNVVREIARHRRSPTAPEPPTAAAMMRDRVEPGEVYGSVSSGEREGEQIWENEKERGKEEELEKEKDSERERKWQQIQQLQSISAASSQSGTAIPQAGGPAPPPPTYSHFNRHIVVNKKAYARLDMIGKGGSSRVFRCLNHANELHAIKRVTLDKIDAETMNGFMNEIALLKRLEGNSRIIRLIDSEVKPGPGGSKGHLLLVMECGEIDLSSLLLEQMKEPVNMVWVSYYWQQMLQAVHVIHEEKIVHSDLKPANFVLVRGQLKLIDFGIANAIANDTTNIQRDHQMGTLNYMSPEAIELSDGMRRLKVGRSSDVWSLGCILYQMVYGHPPFYHLSMYQKMKAIPDVTHVIEFADHATPMMPASKTKTPNGSATVEPMKKLDHLKQRVRKDVIMSMKSCLCRNPKERASIPELLNHSWLSNSEPASLPAKELLKENEAIINPYYMHQLLEYGIKLASEGGLNSQSLLQDAERLVQELKAIQH